MCILSQTITRLCQRRNALFLVVTQEHIEGVLGVMADFVEIDDVSQRMVRCMGDTEPSPDFMKMFVCTNEQAVHALYLATKGDDDAGPSSAVALDVFQHENMPEHMELLRVVARDCDGFMHFLSDKIVVRANAFAGDVTLKAHLRRMLDSLYGCVPVFDTLESIEKCRQHVHEGFPQLDNVDFEGMMSMDGFMYNHCNPMTSWKDE